MNRRLIGVFVFALLVATLSSFAAYRLIIRQMHAPAPSKPAARLIVAARDLQVGALIRDSDVSEIPWTDPIPEQAIRNKQDIVGRGVVEPIYENEPILERRVAPKGSGAGLAATIPIGMRAVALRVDDVIGLAGFVLPGMRVDVLVSGDAGSNSKAGTMCRTVLQNIEVLSAGTRIEKNIEGKPQSAQVVNLLVTPEQAEILSLASDETKIQLVLRNPIDTKEQVTHGASLASLFGQQPVLAAVAARQSFTPPPAPVRPRHAAPPAPREPAEPAIEVFSGTKRTQ